MKNRCIVAALAMLAAPAAWAGSPHFVSVDVSRTDDSLICAGKEAGLGSETQVHILCTATAECINGGSKHPKAENKDSLAAEGDFPVQNGKAEFSLTLTADFQPDCSPPMSVVFTDIVVEDVEHGVIYRVPGTL